MDGFAHLGFLLQSGTQISQKSAKNLFFSDTKSVATHIARNIPKFLD